MTIGPFVITKDIDQGMFKRLEQLVPLGKERIRAGARATLQVAVMNHKNDVRAVDGGDQIRQFRLLLGGVREIADDGELKALRCRPRLNWRGRPAPCRKSDPQHRPHDNTDRLKTHGRSPDYPDFWYETSERS